MLQTDSLEDSNQRKVKVQVQNKQTGLTFKLKAQQKPEQPYVFELDYIDEMQFLKNNLQAVDKVSMKVKTFDCPLPQVPVEASA